MVDGFQTGFLSWMSSCWFELRLLPKPESRPKPPDEGLLLE
jgi:hypothetical protein